MKKLIALTCIAAVLLSNTVMAQDKGVINVTGNGVLKVSPNIAYINVGVRTTAKDAETASAENTKIAANVLDKLKVAGVSEQDVKTQNYYIYPMYETSDGRSAPLVSGYEINNTLTVTVRDIESVGKIIDAAISGGSNVMNGLSYGVEDPSIYYDQLYAKAFDDADKKANSIANRLGVKLSAPVSVSENGYVAPLSYRSFDAMVNVTQSMPAAVGAGTYTTPGEIELLSNLYVVYEY